MTESVSTLHMLRLLAIERCKNAAPLIAWAEDLLRDLERIPSVAFAPAGIEELRNAIRKAKG